MKKLALLAALLAGCTPNAQQQIKMLQSFTLTDIDYALFWATHNKDQPAIECLTELYFDVYALKQQDQSKFGVFTWGQIARDLVRPGSQLNIHCQGLKAEVRTDAIDFIGTLQSIMGSTAAL